MRTQKRATDPSTCNSCGAEIFWVEWASGKRMPIDSLPHVDGDIVVTFKPHENKLLAAKFSQLDEDHQKGRRRFVSHFSSCPNAKEHRKAK